MVLLLDTGSIDGFSVEYWVNRWFYVHVFTFNDLNRNLEFF